MIEQLLQADRLLTVDQVDQAEAIYQHIADLDPMDAIAVVGLARCAVARGQDRRAHELALRALSIDPENDVARRMEARLAEVLAVRGEVVARPTTVTPPSTPSSVTPAPGDEAAGSARGPVEPTPRRRGLRDLIRGR